MTHAASRKSKARRHPDPAQPARPATIKDVARACGLAPSTVSNALSGKPVVRPETRAAVEAAAARLGYRASSLARGLRLQRTWTVGALVADIANPFFADLVRGMEDRLWAEGYSLAICSTDYDPAKEAALLHLLLDKRLDGLILASTAADSDEILRLGRLGVPFVLLNRRHVRQPADYVGMANAAGTAAAVAHLADLGHRRIAFIKGPERSSAAGERLEGYRSEMGRRFGPVDEALIAPGDYAAEQGRAAVDRFLALPAPPSAIVSANDFMALGAMERLRERGLAVPRDLSVVGFDDIFVAALPWIGLTTVRPHSRDLGARAAELLLSRIGRPPGAPREVILPCDLVVRGTTGPAAPSAPRSSRRRATASRR